MAKKALISKVEPREFGFRVAQVEDAKNIFEVSDKLEWIDCADNVVADQFWYDPSDKLIKPNPIVIEKILEFPTIENLTEQLAIIQSQLATLTKIK